MLSTRIITAAVLLAGLLAAVLLLAPAHFAIVVAALIGLGAWEWAGLCRFGRATAFAAAACAAVLFAALARLLWPVSAADGPEMAIFGAAALFWLVLVPLWLRRGVKGGQRSLLTLSGFVVLVPAGLAMLAVSGKILLGLLAIAWIADTGAYFAGRRFGRRKLAPSVSPGKTWEGVAGGLAACILYAAICVALVPALTARVQGVVWPFYLAGVGLLCALSVLGDLFESALKRQAGVKDSGRLLPGHGGVLDRIDSATATLPVAVLLLELGMKT